MVSKFPIITKERQALHERACAENEKLKAMVPIIPAICGYYGRACRCMDKEAGFTHCITCSLRVFVSMVDAIMEVCREKHIGVTHLCDSDILDVQKKLEHTAAVNPVYIEEVLDALVNH